MLEGLELSEIMLSNLERTKRIDAEFYELNNLVVLERLLSKNAKPLTNFISVSDGNHMSISDYYCDNGGVPYYRGSDMGSFFIEQAYSSYMIERRAFDIPNMKRSHLKSGDVLLSIVGTIGSVALVSTDEPATCNCKLAILRPHSIGAEYLAMFLKSQYGQNQIHKSTRGAVQQGFILEDMNQVLIPRFSLDFENEIGKIVQLVKNTLKKSDSTYTAAETLLLQTLGLANFSPSSEQVNIKSFKDSFGTSGRLDAEYYQPKYEQVVSQIKRLPWQSLGYFIDNYSTGYPYKSEDYIERSELPLIRINNIKKGFLDITNAAFLPEVQKHLSEKDIANENDLLISMSGTIGNTCVVPMGITAVVNQRIMRLTPKNYNPLVLMLIINSIVGSSQLERIGTGGVQTNISSGDISQIIIPALDMNTQQEIATLIQQSFTLKAQSEHLLDVAKRAVEIAIEQDEQTAMDYINVQMGA